MMMMLLLMLMMLMLMLMMLKTATLHCRRLAPALAALLHRLHRRPVVHLCRAVVQKFRHHLLRLTILHHLLLRLAILHHHLLRQVVRLFLVQPMPHPLRQPKMLAMVSMTTTKVTNLFLKST